MASSSTIDQDTFPTWPYYDDAQCEIAAEILRSGRVNQWTGNNTKSFEESFSCYIGVDYSSALSNGSVALSCAYSSLGIGFNDEIITTPRSFIATASCAALLGAVPVFADVDLDSGSITAESIEPHISKKTKAISVVHLGGWPADMLSICELAEAYNLFVIEDCAQAHGAKIGTKSVGTFGDVSTWSFCQDKIISTAGEGGMLSTSNAHIDSFTKSYRDHGKNTSLILDKQPSNDYRWIHESLGTNYRLTEIQSAIGLAQLSLLPHWSEVRRINASILICALEGISCVRLPLVPPSLTHAWYKFYFYLRPEHLASGWTRASVIEAINHLGYPAYSGSCSELYREACFSHIYPDSSYSLPNAKELGENSVMLVVHPTISVDLMQKYADIVGSVLTSACKSPL